MNKNALLSMMQLYGDTGGKLAKYLNIARTTFSAKLNETNGAEFTQNEIKLIKNKYNLCAEQIDFIFFSQVCLIKTHMTGMLDYGSEVRAMDKKVENIKALQAELDRRTAVEKLAEKMIIEGKFAEAKELLDTLDDDKNVFYLCNGQKEDCKKRTCYMNGDKSDHTCFWTRDVRYAKNFEKNKDVVAEDVYYEKRDRLKQ